MTADGGLRERKRRRTRAALHEAAVQLAGVKGWDATTIAEIAEMAEVAPRTFFSYFESKEAVLFAPWEDAFVAFEHALAERPHGGTALEELRQWLIDEIIDAPVVEPEADALLDRLLDESAAVNMHGLAILERLERHLSRAIAADLGVDDEDPLPHITAAATAAAMYKATTGSAFTSAERPEHQLAVFDTAMEFARGGLAAVRASPRWPLAVSDDGIRAAGVRPQ